MIQKRRLKLAAWVWLLAIGVVLALAIKSEPTVDSSIMSLLPISEHRPLAQEAIEQVSASFSKRLVILASAKDEKKAQEAINSLAQSLETLAEVSHVYWTLSESEMGEIQDELYPYRFSILDEASREHLINNRFDNIQAKALSSLYSPLGARVSLIDDPFGLFGTLNLNHQRTSGIQVSNGFLQVTDATLPTYMMAVTLAGDPFRPAIQQKVLGQVKELSKVLHELGVTLRMSGMLLHAEAGAKQANHEIMTIGLGSFLGIAVVMLWVFRQLTPLLLMIVPVLLGTVVATSVTLLVFGQVHLITLAFGVGLVGVSIDYALHFICVRQGLAADKVLGRILPGLLLGLFSSVMAYAAQSYAPFPGLQQMAVFSVVGLSASCLTVILWFPLLTSKVSPKAVEVIGKLESIRYNAFRLNASPLVIIVLIIVCGLSIKTVSESVSIDDVRLLQTSPKTLLDQDRDVQRLLGGTSSAQFLLIKGATIEQCLQKEERLAPLLNELVKEGLLGGYQALSGQLPSLNRQRENVELVKQLYARQIAPFFKILKIPEEKMNEANEALTASQATLLTSDAWFRLKGSRVWSGLIVGEDNHSAATIIRLSGNLSEASKLSLQKLSENKEGVDFVDQVQNISNVLVSYRQEVTVLLMLAYLGVFLVLTGRYKRQVWRVVLPSLLASVITLALLVWLEQGLNLFHIMALILVLGIGLDMGVFLIETNGSAYTWLAVSLSTYTSLLAFGLLAFSDTPVLHHYGVTVLIGLVCVWLLTLGMCKQPAKEIDL